MKYSDIKPGDIVRVYDYTRKRRVQFAASPLVGPSAVLDGHKFGLVVSEYPDDDVWPSDLHKYGNPNEPYEREWNIILIGQESSIGGSNNKIVVHENRLERMVEE